MNVLFDPQVFSFQEYGGISRYYCELFKQFTLMEGIEPSLIIEYSNSHCLPELHSVEAKHFFPSYRFKGRNEIIKLLNRMYVKRNFHLESRPDVFHPTYYDPYFIDLLGDIPFVLTIYDMSHELYPQLFSKFDFTAENKKKVSAKANRIIAISEHTKKDIVSLLHIPASKIDVIPLATTLSPTSMGNAVFPLPDKYILYVGKRNTYKNFSFLLEAIKTLSQLNIMSSLICAGGGKFTMQERKKIHRLQLSDKISQIDIHDNQLEYLYSKAQAFVFPSLYEGFGIPILEAFACGCPVLVSNRSSLPEVGGDAARYFDPESIPSLVERLAEVIEDKTLAEDMRTKGFNRSKLFSWENTALKTIETYKKVSS
ncbi:MAG: glycosyltransferase family 1 protein [Ignavibacteriales bacterium]|nr:glycosyltransferase family 1 protein [Ignavibacteriales bacterium]